MIHHVVAFMQKNSMKKIKTFSIGFDDATYNEAEDAKKYPLISGQIIKNYIYLKRIC